MAEMRYGSSESSPTSSGAATPAHSYGYVPTVVSNALGGLFRRSTDLPSSSRERTIPHPLTFPSDAQGEMSGVYTPPYRTASPLSAPFQPPPLYPLDLKGCRTPSAQILSRAIAEEIRLLLPPRLQLCEDWNLVYSLEQDGVSLGTLYKNCEDLRGLRNGFVLVVRDGMGDLFGAYLTEAPHVSPHYFGTGECFLWKASILSSSILANLPPPPSADTTDATRCTTIGAPKLADPLRSPHLQPPTPTHHSSGSSTPDRIRFKAFPYSGVNDYMMLCDSTFISVGGGDGHYGLWLDDIFEKGISSPCPTFGNESLSEEGTKFEILGVELWTVGNI